MFKENTFYRATRYVNLSLWEEGVHIEKNDVLYMVAVSMYSDTEQKVDLIFNFKEIKDVIWDLDKCSWLSEIA